VSSPPTPAAPQGLLPAIVLAQLGGTSSWFAVNAVMPDLQAAFGWPAAAVGPLTAALQGGFIAGTLVFALLAVADRLPARAVFLACALLAAAATVLAAVVAHSIPALTACRVATGFFLAGIYPVGMKIAAQWHPQGLGRALGWLVGALVLGSASPHALRALAAGGFGLPWQAVFAAVAAVTALSGLLLWWRVPATPPVAGRGPGLRLAALATLVTDRRVRASVLGYFGHMVELYTVWVLVPTILLTRLSGAVVSWAAFVVLGAGMAGCVLGGLWAQRVGSARVAVVMLAGSGACCLVAPWALAAPAALFAAWLVLWGFTVAGDSPQFSALTAANAPREAVGSVLTLTNCIGFAISALSIELFVRLAQTVPLAQLLPWLALGPALGLVAMWPLLRERTL
jgi:MFS transporter, DHA1 family, inner membrane transport protein